MGSTSASRRAASWGCSAPTAPARRRRCASWPRSCGPTPGAPPLPGWTWSATPSRSARRSVSPASTQYLEEADELADSIAVVDAGRIIARGTADELKAQVGGERIEVVVHDRADLARAVAVLARHCDGDCTVDEHTRRLTVPANGGA